MNQTNSRAVPIETDQQLPPTSDVVVIGGGILGVSAAYFLARRKIAVTLCEKGVIAGESSSRAHGQVASAGFGMQKMELLVESKRLWGMLSNTIGDDIGYRKNGYIAPCYTSKELEFWECWFDTIKRYEPEASILSGEKARRIANTDRALVGAYYNPSDGCAEPSLSTSIVALSARKLGARILENCAVRGFGCTAGRVSEVITERGSIKTDTVVLAGGAWSMLFAGSLGIELPILNLYANCQSIAPLENGPDGTGDFRDVSWRRELDGGYSLSVIGVTVPLVPAMFRIGPKFLPARRELGQHWEFKYSLGQQFMKELFTPTSWSMDKPSPFERMRTCAPEIDYAYIRSARERIIGHFSCFKHMKVHEEWAGIVVSTPDNMPTISSVDKIPGLYLLTGFSYGFTMAPGAGYLMADIITGDKPTIDPAPYKYERYIDGRRLMVVS